jgi:hypothetical protein
MSPQSASRLIDDGSGTTDVPKVIPVMVNVFPLLAAFPSKRSNRSGQVSQKAVHLQIEKSFAR